MEVYAQWILNLGMAISNVSRHHPDRRQVGHRAGVGTVVAKRTILVTGGNSNPNNPDVCYTEVFWFISKR
jgi:hypothetical protein